MSEGNLKAYFKAFFKAFERLEGKDTDVSLHFTIGPTPAGPIGPLAPYAVVTLSRIPDGFKPGVNARLFLWSDRSIPGSSLLVCDACL